VLTTIRRGAYAGWDLVYNHDRSAGAARAGALLLVILVCICLLLVLCYFDWQQWLNSFSINSNTYTSYFAMISTHIELNIFFNLSARSIISNHCICPRPRPPPRLAKNSPLASCALAALDRSSLWTGYESSKNALTLVAYVWVIFRIRPKKNEHCSW
jgi:hypothetical protein